MAEERRTSRGSYGAHRGNNGGNRRGKSFGGHSGRGGSSFGGRRGSDFRKSRYQSDGEGRRDRNPRRDGERNEGGERRSYDRGYGQGRGERSGFHGGRDGNPRYRSGGQRRDYRDSGRHDNGDRRELQRDGERSGFRKDGERRSDFKRGGDRRDFRGNGRGFRKDGDRRNWRDGDNRRGGFRSDRGRDDSRGGEGRDFRNNDQRRDFHRDGESRGFRDGGDRRGFRGRDGERREGGNSRFGGDRRRNGDRRFNDRRQGGSYRRDDKKFDRRDDHRDFRRDGEHRGGRRDDDRRDFRRDGERRDFKDQARRNSDGTISFPSQNPYTHRREGEPKMPKGMEWSMLSTEERERLRGLSKEHAENIGLHILAAYSLEEQDPQGALAHAKWVAKQASRIDFARETLAFIAYRQGDYKLALRELRTAYRMNGYLDYLPFIADCERGLGNPKKAIEIGSSDDAKQLRGEAKVEMFLVYAGALADMKLWDKAIDLVHTVARSKGLAGAYRMRAIQAEQYFLEEAGRGEEAVELDQLLDKLELQYADADEDETDENVVIDYDLANLSEDLLEEAGITEDDAQYAPDDFGMEESDDIEDSDESDETDDSAEDAEIPEAVRAQVQGEDMPDESESSDDEETLPARETEAGADAEEDPVVTADDSESNEAASDQSDEGSDQEETENE